MESTRTKKITIGIVVAAAIVIIGGYSLYLINRPHYALTTVTRGSIVQQVRATGNVQSPTTVNLAFQNTGKMTELDAKVGNAVSKGDVLAKQDASVLQAQLAQAQADVAAQTAQLEQLRSGATPQTIAVSRTALALDEQTLTNTYSGIPATLSEAYAKANDAVRTQLSVFFSESETNPQLTFRISDSQTLVNIQAKRQQASQELNVWQTELATMSASSSTAILESAVQNDISHLGTVRALLAEAQKALNAQISLTSAAVNTYSSYVTAGLNEVNTETTALNTTLQNIASEKATIAKAEADLALTMASSTPQDIAAQEAQVQQARARVAAIQAQIAQTVLASPANAVITHTNGSVGEAVAAGTTVVSLIPHGAPEIKLNVSEDNIVGVSVGQSATITLDAFPNGRTWAGKVVSIDPAQTIVSGAVYYKTTVLFDKIDPNVKPGMTANVLVETGAASSTLVVPASAIRTNNTGTYLEVYDGRNVTTENITTGLKSQNGMVEVASGAEEGQQVVTGSQ